MADTAEDLETSSQPIATDVDNLRGLMLAGYGLSVLRNS